MDGTTYKSYQQMGGHIAKLARKYILYDDEMGIYYVRYNPSAKLCPMCDGEQLCVIVKEKGADALCKLCKEFPREHYRTVFAEEKYLSISCPRVVEMLMNLGNKVSFLVEEESGDDKDNDIRNQVEELNMISGRYTIDVEIRRIMLKFIQESDTPLWFREFYGVYVLSKVKENYLSNDCDRLYDNLAKFYSESYWEALHTGLQKMEVNREQQFQSIRILINNMSEQIMKVSFTDMFNSMVRIEELIGINRTCTFEEWERARKKWGEERNFLVEENLFAYDLMENCLPNAKIYPYAFMDEFCLLGNYMINILMVVLTHGFQILSYIKYGYNREMDKIIISMLNRALRGGGDPSYIKEVLDDAKESGIMSVAYIRYLLDI